MKRILWLAGIGLAFCLDHWLGIDFGPCYVALDPIIGAALIGGGATLASGGLGFAGSLLGGGNPDNPIGTAGTDPGANSPLLNALAFDQMIGLGFLDPTVLQRGSPFNRAFQAFASTPQTKKARSGKLLQVAPILGFARDPNVQFNFAPNGDLVSISSTTGQSLAGGDTQRTQRAVSREEQEFLAEFAGRVGLTTRDLFEQETAFQTRLDEVIPQLSEVSREAFDSRIGLRRQLVDLAGAVPTISDLGELREAEAGRIRRDRNLQVDDQIEAAMNAARAAGTNPGGIVGELEEFRARGLQDADLNALGRALATIGGEQQVLGGQANLLNTLLTPPSAVPVGTAASTGFSSGGSTGSGVSGPNNALGALGAGVQGFGETLASGLLASQQAGQNQGLINQLLLSQGITPPAIDRDVENLLASRPDLFG